MHRRLSDQLTPTTFPCRWALAAVRGLGPLWSRLGADRARLETLVALYLMRDERRQKRAGEDGHHASPVSGGMVLTVVFNLVIGLLAAAALVCPDPAIGLALNLGVVMGFLVVVLVTDYSAVLLDDSDLKLFGPLPIPERTLLLSRLVHIGSYLSISVVSLTLPSWILGPFFLPAWIFLPVYLISTLLVTAVSLCLAFGSAAVAARFLDLERLKNALMWIQIAVMICFVGAFQIAPRLIGTIDLLAIPDWVLLALPSGHQGGLMGLALGQTSERNLILAALAIALPLVGGYAVFRIASNGLLSRIAGSDAVTRREARRAKHRVTADLGPSAHLEAAGYDYFAALSSRDRAYRMRVYPLIAIAVCVGLGLAIRREEGRPGAMLCGGIYCLGFYAPMFMLFAKAGENWQGKWILLAAPQSDYGPFVRGTVRAMVRRQILPAFAFALVVILAIGGTGILLDALFATLATLAMAMLVLGLLCGDVPFTEKWNRGKLNTTGPLMGSFVATSVIILGHVFLRRSDGLFTAAIVTAGVLAIAAYVYLRNLHVDAARLID